MKNRHHKMSMALLAVAWLLNGEVVGSAMADPRSTQGSAAVPSPAIRMQREFSRMLLLARLHRRDRNDRTALETAAARFGIATRERLTDGGMLDTLAVRHGAIYAYQTYNLRAGISVGADQLIEHPDYNVSGEGVKVGIWDEGAIRNTHIELVNRVLLRNAVPYATHSTHVGGTVAAAGHDPSARGMMPSATLWSYDWNQDTIEMAEAAMSWPSQDNRLQISNHSYGLTSGWTHRTTPWRWYGTWEDGVRESDYFGKYGIDAQEWDEVCHNAPYFLPFKAAGNDRTDSAPVAGQPFEYFAAGWQQKTYDPATDPLGDGAAKGGYNTIALIGNAKNIVTVGSVTDAVSGSVRDVEQAVVEGYSSFGPTDDGRIKPDLVANGQSLRSPGSGNDFSYLSLSGTSMAAANAAGAAGLLVAFYDALFPGLAMRASTLKALLIHSADTLGHPGPDYVHGWGLINVAAGAALLQRHHDWPAVGRLQEAAVQEGAVFRATVRARGDRPLKITLCWTDPPGAVVYGLNNAALCLVHDLDLTVYGGGSTNFPFMLDPENPSLTATTGRNFRDNVEQVIIQEPASGVVYTVEVTAPAVMQTAEQVFSLLVDGDAAALRIKHEPLSNQMSTGGVYEVQCIIESEVPLRGETLFLQWRIQGTSGYTAVPLEPDGMGGYTASIPGQPEGSVLDYYIEAANTGAGYVTLPADISSPFSFQIVSGTFLIIRGRPDEFGQTEPGYGMHELPVGRMVYAAASATANQTETSRWSCVGWSGIGDVPAAGTGRQTSFVLSSPSALEWKWVHQYRLTLVSTGAPVFSLGTWWDKGATANVPEPPLVYANEEGTFHFVEWRVDGIRQPSATNQAATVLDSILMTHGRTASALYMASDVDVDMDGLPDWWELHYFGSLMYDAYDDPDHDGYLNIEEFRGGSSPVDSDSIPSGPVISHTPLSSPQGAPAPWHVSAAVTSAGTVDMVRLVWRRNGLTWRIAVMPPQGDDLYAAEIDLPGVGGDAFEYYIEASDDAGFYVQTDMYGFAVAYPLHDVSPGSLYSRIPAGLSTSHFVTVHNRGTAPLSWSVSARSVGWANDVPSLDEAPWTHGGYLDDWHISTRRSWSGPYAWYFGMEDSGRYRPRANAWLATPPVLLGHGARLEFMHWPGMELDDTPGYAWDGGVIEISTDGGMGFEAVTPVGGYPYKITPNPDSPFPGHTPCLSGTGGWERVEVDLADYAGQDVMLRFRFGSDRYVEGEGWYIDNVRMLPASTNATWITLQPASGLVEPGKQGGFVADLSAVETEPGIRLHAQLIMTFNDPLTPQMTIPVQLDVCSIPETAVQGARQIATDGTGYVAVSNRLTNADGSPVTVAFWYASGLDGDWLPMTLNTARVSTAGADVVLTSANAWTLSGFAAGHVTNSIVAIWDSRNDIGAGVLVTNLFIRALPATEWFAGDVATGGPFMVDHEPPDPPPMLASATHAIASWSTNPAVELAWMASSDGAGGGVSGYTVGTQRAGIDMGGVISVDTNVTLNLARDSDEWMVSVAAFDVFGNISEPVDFGPLFVDSHPPSATGAVVYLPLSDAGDYYVGTNMTVRWNGFNDVGIGIAGYYFHRVDMGGTQGGFQTTQTSAVVSVVFPDAINEIYVWAYDQLGQIGPAASAARMILSPGSDPDLDGVPSWQEEIAGTDALDPDSVFRFERITPGLVDEQVRLSWQSATGRFYTVYHNVPFGGVTSLWKTVEHAIDIPGSGVMLSTTVRVENVNSAFRLEVRR